MSKTLAFILGGARSGNSAHAQKTCALAGWLGRAANLKGKQRG